MKHRIVWFRSWHFWCPCFWDMKAGAVIAETRRHYVVVTSAHGTRKIAKWRAIEGGARDD